MTTEEMFQLLLSKISENHAELRTDIARLEQNQARMEVNIARLEQNQARIEAKVDANQARIEAKVDANQARMEAKIDANHTKTLDMVVNLRLDLMDIKDKLNEFISEFRLNRTTVSASISELQVRDDAHDREIDKLKKKAS